MRDKQASMASHVYGVNLYHQLDKDLVYVLLAVALEDRILQNTVSVYSMS